MESKLKEGKIPAHEECPYRKKCDGSTYEESSCIAGHIGKKHEVDFSCALARGFDISVQNKTS